MYNIVKKNIKIKIGNKIISKKILKFFECFIKIK